MSNKLSLYKHMDFVFFDKDFVLEKELKQLGFRKTDSDNTYARVIDSVFAIQDDLVDVNLKKLKAETLVWKRQVKSALSANGKAYEHKLRPSSNIFPMMQTGHLRDSLYVKVTDTSVKKAWSFEVTVGFKSPYFKIKDQAMLTNYNVTRAGHNKRKVAWHMWMSDLFYKGKPGIVSVKDLMQSVLY